jgi:phosphoribosylglycinamide formyltransferase-1
MTNLAIFASGNGSNARRLMEHFKGHPSIRVVVLVSNKEDAGALVHADEMKVPSLVIDKNSLQNSRQLLTDLDLYHVHYIILAGFLLLIPDYLIAAYPDKIINIHPALLPRFGGKGMYGMHVHRAVKESGESESGITIHLVDENYDEGKILFQEKCAVEETDTPEDIAGKIRALEHQHFPLVVEKVIGNELTIKG